MKKKLLISICGILFLCIGVSLALYPFISNYLMEQNQASEIVGQQSAVNNMSDSTIEQEFEKAEIYNKSLLENTDNQAGNTQNYDYDSLLNINGDSFMASLEIPRIGLNLSIYHGTSDEVLLKGLGHLQKTSLPIGGKGTHAVITGHTGLSSTKMFTDLNQLEEGDVFFIHVLNKTLAYQVDQIKIISPSDTSDLTIDPEQDYVTLLTCTPYGTNTHRLLVRGTRIPYEQAEEIASQTEPAESTWMLEYKRALIIGTIIFILVILIFVAIKIYLKKRNKIKNLQ